MISPENTMTILLIAGPPAHVADKFLPSLPWGSEDVLQLASSPLNGLLHLPWPSSMFLLWPSVHVSTCVKLAALFRG